VIAARGLVGRAAPGRAVSFLTAAATVSALTQIWALALLAGSLVDDLPFNPASTWFPVPDWVSLIAAGALGIAPWRTASVGVPLLRQRAQLRNALATATGDLVVLPDRRPHAFAVPGRPGRVVVTDTMLRILSPEQRRVLLAHERAHLIYRHSWALGLS